MKTPWHARLSPLLFPLLLQAALGATACQSTGSDGSGSVCPTCDPQTGGDTGDFGGEISMCEGLSRPVVVDEAEAIALGFAVPEIKRRLSEPFDEPMRWYADPNVKAGGAASGFQPDTRLRAVTTILSYSYVRPDPAFCDGTTCIETYPDGRESEPVLQATCGRRLHVNVRVEVSTLDGALRASATGVAMQLFAGSGGEGAAGPGVLVDGYARADLHEVTGKLRLSPSSDGMDYHGLLDIDFFLLQDGTRTFSVSPHVTFKRGLTTQYYRPISGQSPPTEGAVDSGGPRNEGDVGARGDAGS